MSYTTKQWRAINNYIKKHNLRPELSAYPMVRFTGKDTGDITEVHISTIEDLYMADKEKERRNKREDAKEAARAKKQANIPKFTEFSGQELTYLRRQHVEEDGRSD